jgi:hypothetical protein
MSRIFNSNRAEIPDHLLQPTGEMAASLKLFRDAMHAIAARETGHPVAADLLLPARRRHRRAQRRMALAWACAVALSFAVLPHSSQPPVAPHRSIAKTLPEPPRSDISDIALLEQVDDAISEAVPSSLAPLTELDSWDSTASTTPKETEHVTQ